MFRITQYIQELRQPTPLSPRRPPTGPVVIWNLVRRCNLTCKHCYSTSADKDFPGELSTAEVYRVMDDLKQFGVPALILSGGEPLMRRDIFDIGSQARHLGFYVGLSSNGTLIDDSNIDAIDTNGFNYVGISLDGIGATHDHIRRRDGAFDAALRGIRLCKSREIKVGLRFTLTQENANELPLLLQLLDDEGVDKFYLSHLNYAGRGNKNRRDDAFHRTTRQAMLQLFETCLYYLEQGKPKEFVTGNNDADAIYMMQWAKQHFPSQVEHLRRKLAQWGGNASGVNIANIDNLGNVHPDTMWWNHSLGNVRNRPFSAIWEDISDPLMAGLKQHPHPVTGRCGRCAYLDICNGNTRIRAWQTSGDPWAEDPACYLTDQELGIAPPLETLLDV